MQVCNVTTPAQYFHVLRRQTKRKFLKPLVIMTPKSLLRAPDCVSDESDFTKGTFEEINDYFYRNELSDGLPIVPPTRERIGRFLARTDLPPQHVIGILPPEQRAATVWSVAVNGAMAGCRPEYMPILVALVEAMADPYYGVEHSGNTPGAETQIILNGPIITELGFNHTQGATRDGHRPNTSIGRFWRLYLRNVAGFRLHQNDKATYGNTWRVVVAENEDVKEFYLGLSASGRKSYREVKHYKRRKRWLA